VQLSIVASASDSLGGRNLSTVIFARNFRGFKKIDISLDENIFLVGDNSSGKSSILHLINFVSIGDLIGLPNMNVDHHISKNEFFSPYFDYADVSLGFTSSGDEEKVSRIITLSRLRQASTYYVKSCTFASEKGALTLKVSKQLELKGRFEKGPNFLSVETLEQQHNKRTGFQQLKLKPDTYINEAQVLFRSLLELLPRGASEQEFAGLIFAQPMQSTQFIGPMRERPEGYYAFDRRIRPTGGHFATLLNDVSKTERNEIDDAVKAFGKESGLFDNLIVTKASNKIANSPLHVFVEKNKKTFLLNQVGIGVSQVAPIIADTLAASKGLINPQRFLIQQPELHLHPKAQAAFGEYLHKIAQSGTRFCIETHSDFLIDRFRANIKNSEGNTPAAIIYCRSDVNGNHSDRIEINDDGTLSDPPEGYLDFFINELARTMI
jgi:hypothetical protein